jgi:hypothetical protein
MTNARARLALLCVLAFVAMTAAIPAGADAYVSYYDCYMKASNSWCDGKANGSFDQIDDYDYNEGWYPGPWDNTVQACQRLLRTTDGVTMGGTSCQFNYTSNYYGALTCVCYEANAKQISGGNHSINGMADSNF